MPVRVCERCWATKNKSGSKITAIIRTVDVCNECFEILKRDNQIRINIGKRIIKGDMKTLEEKNRTIVNPNKEGIKKYPKQKKKYNLDKWAIVNKGGLIIEKYRTKACAIKELSQKYKDKGYKLERM